MKRRAAGLKLIMRMIGMTLLPFLLLTTLTVTLAIAASLDEAKAAGYLGERPDGYVGLVTEDAPDWARQLVNQINAQRRQAYAELAQGTPGATVREVGIIAGRKLIERAPSGHYVMSELGQWEVKR